MRFFRGKIKTNWRYIIGEILLIFVGINLAIWFNNWNSDKKIEKDKSIAISKIRNEINSNIQELIAANDANIRTMQAYQNYSDFFLKNTSQVMATPKKMWELKEQFNDFFRVEDSVVMENGMYRYTGTTFLQLEIPELTQIAWETTKSLSITNEFDYECLYGLESMYNSQRRVQNEIDKATDALQKRDLSGLMNILQFLEQLDEQLLEDYKNMVGRIDNCG